MADAHDELVSSFCSVTGVSADEAIEHLSTAEWDSNLALANYFQAQEGDSGAAEDAPAAEAEPAYTGPRTLDGRPAPSSVRGGGSGSGGFASSSSSKPQKKKGLMTMSSLRGSSSHDHDHGHDHDDDDDDDFEEENRGRGDLFAGGEKSGLAVQDPNAGGPTNAQKLIRGILAKARANNEREGAGPSESAPLRNWGAGQTLGGDGVESRAIPGPQASGSRPAAAAPAVPEDVQERVLHIWQDGFSIDDGPLHRFDDPGNAADLQLIRQGRAPMHLMNVPFGQAVDVKLHQHEENWHQLPRVYRPFSGEGRRLGSPAAATPTTTSATTATTASTPQSSTAASTAATSAAPALPTIDESQPTIMIRVTLPDGTRLPARFNASQTIEQVYEFVERAMPASQTAGRAWLLSSFPNKEHTDKSLVLGETDEFKRGGTAIVKWA